MNLQDLRHWQHERDKLHRSALEEAVAALDSRDSEGEHVTHQEAMAGYRTHSESACILLKRAAECARRARIGEQSTMGEFRAPEQG